MTRWKSELDNDLKWREDELASLKHHAISTRNSPVPHRAALRALWAMLYAHYEGFTKFCWELALDEIERSNVRRCDVLDTLAIASLENVFVEFRANTKSSRIWEFAKIELPNEMNGHAKFDSRCRFSTGSNLWPDVFLRETLKLGVRCSKVNESMIQLKALVSRRNKIAHGEQMVINTLNEYKPYEDAAKLVMYELACEIDDLLSNKLYLKS